MERMAAEHGVGIVWWLHPNLGRTPGWRRMHANRDIRFLIAFDDPVRFPDFYKVRWHFDLFHLTRKGSAMMTEVFAREFLTLTGESETRRAR